jgi:hypothetical protein
VGKA